MSPPMAEPVRKEESKIVMSKLPRDEFASFIKICERENKTVNKKIRELINKEANSTKGHERVVLTKMKEGIESSWENSKFKSLLSLKNDL